MSNFFSTRLSCGHFIDYFLILLKFIRQEIHHQYPRFSFMVACHGTISFQEH